MIRRALKLTAMAVCLVTAFLLGSILMAVKTDTHATGFAAVLGEKGGQDYTGPYEVVPDWPKPLTSLPGHEKWTWGAAESIFAQNPNRIFLLQRGELPALKRPPNTPIREFGPSLSFPVNEVPFRNTSQGPVAGWKGKIGVDACWEHCLVVVDAEGNIIEDWAQWNTLFRRPHYIPINPYDPEKHVWVVEDARHDL
jgi:hypothetical protein